MRPVRVGAVALNQTPLDWDGNRDRIRAALADARAHDVAIVCLPELCVSGYGCEDAFLSPNTLGRAWEVLAELLPSSRGLIASVGLPVLHQGAVYNGAALLVDGALAGVACKHHLAGDGLHYEPRWFKPWPGGIVERVAPDARFFASGGRIHGEAREAPIGDLLFDCGGLRLGFEICEDAWVAERPGGTLARRGLDVLLNPSASHFAFGKDEVRERFVLEGSRAFAVTYIYANLLGNEAGRAIYDGGCFIATASRLAARGRRFSYRDHELTVAVADIDTTRMQQARTASFRPLLGEDGAVTAVPFAVPIADTVPATAPAPAEPWERGDGEKAEEFARAVALGLWDYLRKSRSSGFVVSISGGADSAAVSCLCAMAVAWARRELSPVGLAARIPWVRDLQADAEVSRLLTCVYQATRNSSVVTESAARGVANALGARYVRLDVDALVAGYTSIVQRALGRGLSWAEDDIALQNVQARARSPSVWMLANVGNALLLSTSNRSEAAVGYATMDGDTSGGLAPIAGIDKAWLRKWLVWLEQRGPDGLFAVPALAAVNGQAPTAELRPPGSHQTDEGDLMPYPVLDAIERAAIRDKHGPADTLAVVAPAFPEYGAELRGWVIRFFRLWSRNQWKRERYAPSFHVDDENLDPKTWCRFPILSGGFERELRELEGG